MRKKLTNSKILIMLTVISTLLLVNVSAASYDAKFDGSELIINSDAKENSGFLTYIFSDKLASDCEITDSILTGGNLKAVVVIKDATTVIDLGKNAPNGVYTVVFGGNEPLSERMAYILKAPADAKEKALRDINSAKNSQELANAILSNNNLAYMLDLENLDDIKDALFGIVDENGCPDVDKIQNYYDLAEEISKLENANPAEIAKILLNNKETFGLGDDILKYSDEVGKELKSAIENGLECTKFSKLKSKVNGLLAVIALNNAGRGDKISTIEKYNDIFNVDFSPRLNLVDGYELGKLLSEITFDDTNEVERLVNNAIEKLYNQKSVKEENITSSSKHGGGGGANSGITAPSVVTPNNLDISASASSNKADFSDIGGYEWAKEAISYLADNNIMSGDGNGTFRPGDYLKREELVKILVSAFGKGEVLEADISFTDVEDDKWYTPYVKTAYLKEIVKGISETYFGIGEYVTRQDAAVMIVRAADSYYKDINKEVTLVDFLDYDTVADYALISVDRLARAKIINGFEDGTFRPNDNITRAEIAKIIYGCIASGEER